MSLCSIELIFDAHVLIWPSLEYNRERNARYKLCSWCRCESPFIPINRNKMLYITIQSKHFKIKRSTTIHVTHNVTRCKRAARKLYRYESRFPHLLSLLDITSWHTHDCKSEKKSNDSVSKRNWRNYLVKS